MHSPSVVLPLYQTRLQTMGQAQSRAVYTKTSCCVLGPSNAGRLMLAFHGRVHPITECAHDRVMSVMIP